MKLQKLQDKCEIEAFLRKDPYLHIYEIGDLDDFFWPHTKWYACTQDGETRALFLLYTGVELPCLLALEETDTAAAVQLLMKLKTELPGKSYCHMSPALRTMAERIFRAEHHGPYMKMRLKRDKFQPTTHSCHRTKNLGQADLEEVLALYASAYPDNWFDRRMLGTGKYFALFQHDAMAAVAGVHVYSAQYRVAALGNITVHPKARGAGLGAVITSRLCEELFEDVDIIGLNVSQNNIPAIRSYRKLGFVEHCQYDEIMLFNC